MHPVFKKLGLPPEIRAFFNLSKPVFFYGKDIEHFDEDCHIIPTTTSLWKHGSSFAPEVIICNCAMEAIAFLAINKHKYPYPDQLLFLATGNLPGTIQLKGLSKELAKRKITLAFGRDILGGLCDIKLAAALKNQPVNFSLVKSQIHLRFKEKLYVFRQDELTLSAFEKLSGLRSNCRTAKPKNYNTFLDQLKCYGK